MSKEEIINLVANNFKNEAKDIMLKQLNLFYEIENKTLQNEKYLLGEEIILKKGTMIHGTYKNLEGLKEIVKNGLIASDFINSRKTKYPACVSVWNLKNDYKLKDYINFGSGATIKYHGLLIDNEYSNKNKTEVIKYDELNNLTSILEKNPCRMWEMEQTKEARFIPSLVQNKVQIAIIFKNNEYTQRIINNGDILDNQIINDTAVKEFVHEDYYENFIKERQNKDDFFTDRENAILYGIPANCIDGILVGRDYENNQEILNQIEVLLPNAYICNIDGVIIKGN